MPLQKVESYGSRSKSLELKEYEPYLPVPRTKEYRKGITLYLRRL